MVLTTMHLDHEPENCGDENLLAGCQRCHNLYDAPKRRAGIKERALQARIESGEMLLPLEDSDGPR